MIFKIENNFLQNLVKILPYIRYNDTQFYLVEESYYSIDGKKEIPWRNPKQSIIHRLTAEISLNKEKVDFEKDLNTFLDFCDYFLDSTKTKTYTNIKHTLLKGTREGLKYSIIYNWNTLEELFEELNLKEYFYLNRFLIKIPYGSLNLNITKIENIKDLFLEIIELDPNQDLQKIIKDLNLNNSINKNWTDIALSI